MRRSKRFEPDPENNHCIIDTDAAPSSLERKFWVWTCNEQIALDVINRLNGLDYANKLIKALDRNTEEIYEKIVELDEIYPQLTCHIPTEKSCKHYHACLENNMTNAYNAGRRSMFDDILKILIDEFK